MLLRLYELAERDPEIAAALPVFPPWLGVLVAVLYVSAVFMREERS